MAKNSKKTKSLTINKSEKPSGLLQPEALSAQSNVSPTTQKTAMHPVLLIAGIAIAVYFNTLFNGFVDDDLYIIVKNPWIKNFKFLPQVLTSPLLSTYYRPLSAISYMCIFNICGLTPAGFHLFSILMHAANSLLVFLITSYLFRQKDLLPSAGSPALPANFFSSPFIASMLFAVNPIHIEAVAWISAASELSFSFFCLLSLWFYMRCREGFKLGYFLSLASFSAATFCKETSLTLPLILIAYDYAFRHQRENISYLLRRYFPYFIIGAIYLALRYNVLRNSVVADTDKGLTTWQYLVNVFPLFMASLKDLILPFDLDVWRFHLIKSIFTASGILSIIVALLYLSIVLLTHRINKTAFFSLLFILLPLLPAFYIKGILGGNYASRYLYLPSVGFAILIAMLFDFLSKKASRHMIYTAAVALFIATLYSYQTITTIPIWKSNLTLYTDTVKRFPMDTWAYGRLAEALAANGRFDDAIETVRQGLRRQPDNVYFHRVRAQVLIDGGRNAEAKKIVEQELQSQPSNAFFHNALGLIYAHTGLYEKSIEQFKIAVYLSPSDPITQRNLDAAIALKNGTAQLERAAPLH